MGAQLCGIDSVEVCDPKASRAVWVGTGNGSLALQLLFSGKLLTLVMRDELRNT